MTSTWGGIQVTDELLLEIIKSFVLALHLSTELSPLFIHKCIHSNVDQNILRQNLRRRQLKVERHGHGRYSIFAFYIIKCYRPEKDDNEYFKCTDRVCIWDRWSPVDTCIDCAHIVLRWDSDNADRVTCRRGRSPRSRSCRRATAAYPCAYRAVPALTTVCSPSASTYTWGRWSRRDSGTETDGRTRRSVCNRRGRSLATDTHHTSLDTLVISVTLSQYAKTFYVTHVVVLKQISAVRLVDMIRPRRQPAVVCIAGDERTNELCGGSLINTIYTTLFTFNRYEGRKLYRWRSENTPSRRFRPILFVVDSEKNVFQSLPTGIPTQSCCG